MTTPEEAKESAVAKFKSGLNCTQAVVLTFAKELGFDEETLTTLVQPFGGGMCRMREVCGTMSGMLFCLGMAQKYLGDRQAVSSDQIMASGVLPEKQAKDNVYAIGQELAAKFREMNGSIICRELLGLVPMGTSEALMKAGMADSHAGDAPVSEERTEDYYKKRPCAELCGIAAEIFAEYLANALK